MMESQSTLATIVRDSLNRIQAYIMNIAELVVDYAVLKENDAKIQSNTETP